MNILQSFGQWCRIRRRELDLTQAELAKRTNCAQVTIKKIEAGELRPSKQMAEILIKQLGIEVDEQEALIRFARGGPEPTATSLRIPKNNLPIELNSFIGRERELLEVKQLITSSRLVTLTGVGGVGKTRLSIQAGAELLDQFIHGVWFAELAPVSNPGALPETLLSLFKLSEQENKSSLETLHEFLYSKNILIILDNCEHLIDETTNFALALLKNTASVRIVATSREAMNVVGEKIYQVPPLSIPDFKKSFEDPTQLNQYESVRLFIERASQVSSKFNVDKKNAPALAEICHRLDGLPLAIELAAARIKMMGIEQINIHLNDRFRLLTGGKRTALPRQKTLRALIDWSYDLLSSPEKLMLQRVSVFVNGWTLEAALQICRPEQIDGESTMDLLSNLIDKSLISFDEHSDGARYHILETIRQYAAEKLLENSEHDLLREWHLKYYMELAERFELMLKTDQQMATVHQLYADLDNLRSAISWSFSNPSHIVSGLRLACALEKFTEWDETLHREHLEWYQNGLALLSTQDTEAKLIRAKTLCLAGGLVSHFGNYLSGQHMLEEGVAIFRNEPLTEKRQLAYSLNILAIVNYMDAAPRAREIGEESIEICRTLGEPGLWDLAESLRMNGWVAYWQNDFELARRRAEESDVLFRKLGDNFSVSDTIHLLGQIAHLKGEYAVARPYYDECLRLNQNHGLKEYEILAIFSLADLDRLTGNYPAAHAGYREALKYYQENGDIFGEGKTLTNLARVTILEGMYDDAIVLLRKGISLFTTMYRYVEMGMGLHAFADALRGKGNLKHAAQFLGAIYSTSNHFKPINKTAYNLSVEMTKNKMEHKDFSSAWEEGASMTLEDAVETALNVMHLNISSG